MLGRLSARAGARFSRAHAPATRWVWRGMWRALAWEAGPLSQWFYAEMKTAGLENHGTLSLIADALLKARAALGLEFQTIEKRLLTIARADKRVRRLVTTPGVGALVGLTFSEGV